MSSGVEVASEINEVLTFLHLCEDDKHNISVSLKTMDGAIPCFGAGAANDVKILFNSGEPAVWPLNVITVATTEGFDDPNDKWPEGSLQFSRLTSITTAQARARGATRFSRYMAFDGSVTAMPSGASKSGGGTFAFLGGDWVQAQRNVIYPPNWQRRVHLAAGWALTLRYEWSVWLGHGAGPRVRFLTDPNGAREVFRLRDIPQGGSRRAALRNWVNAHWRQKRADPDSTSWVKKHLRGAEEFSWNGLRCKVSPPEFDLERLNADAR